MEHLALMEKVLDQRLPTALTNKSLQRHKKETKMETANNPMEHSFLNMDNGTLLWPEKAESKNSIDMVENTHTLSQNLNHPSTIQLLDLLTKLLQFDPNLRLTANEALNHPFFNNMREYMIEELV